MKTTDRTDASRNRNVRTFGEIFADGSVLELVTPAVGDQPDLVFWDGAKIAISSEIEHRGKFYRAETLHPTILRATRFPREPVGYGGFGTIRQLFAELATTFEKFLAFSRSESERATFWVLTTWFCDCLSSPPSLWISGADLGRAAGLFALMHCLCRRPLRVAGITRGGFLSLPSSFRPTLLVNQPTLSAGIQSLWSDSNFHGFCVPGSRGIVHDVTSSKAIFMGMAGAATSPSAGHLHVALFPDREVSALDEAELNTIAEYFLPRLLQYRLEQAIKVRESRFAPADLHFPIRELAGNLGACVQGDADLALQVVPLLLAQNDVGGGCNLDCAVIEVLWPRLHSTPPNTVAHMRIEAELTAEVNTFMLSCGDNLQYSREEVGIRVARLELTRKRTNGGTILLLGAETNGRVHQLARAYGIDKSMPGCPYCKQAQEPVV